MEGARERELERRYTSERRQCNGIFVLELVFCRPACVGHGHHHHHHYQHHYHYHYHYHYSHITGWYAWSPSQLVVGSSVDATRHAGGCEGARARVSYTMLFSTDDLFAFYLSCFSCTVWEAVAIYTCLARYPST